MPTNGRLFQCALRESTNFDMVWVTGSIPVAPTTHSRFLPTCGDAPKMPTNGGLFHASFESPSLRKGQTANFGPQSPRQKIPFLAPEKMWCRELRLEGVAA